MPIPLCLAMTAAEMATCTAVPSHVGWLACHFSPSGSGLSNIPKTLPSQSLLILDDSTPFAGHQPDVIIQQLQNIIESLKPEALILDFQRPSEPDVQNLSYMLQTKLPCVVAAPPNFSVPNAPVFLPSCPPNRLIKEYTEPFRGRKIFLETALDGMMIRVTTNGCRKESCFFEHAESFPYIDEKLHCHYHIAHNDNAVEFSLQRTYEDCIKLLEEACTLGVTCAVGLWQEFTK